MCPLMVEPLQTALTTTADAPSLKGRNRRHFLSILRSNLKAALAGTGARVEGGGAVLAIAVADELAADEVASRLERVFGFATASVCLRCEREVDRIAEVGMVAFARGRPENFAVRVRRRDKAFPLTSQDLEREIGAALQARTGLPVNLRRPDLELRVELDSAAAYVHVREIDGAGGLPVGTSGRAVCLLSGGIDSPVAALLAMKRGLEVEFLHFSGEPYLDPLAATKAQAQARVLNGFQAARPGHMWVVPFGNQQRMLSAVSDESHRIVLYRRQMARVACALARHVGAAALVTGDSLGQVSSQTLPNMTATEDASDLPVLRPLLTWDKREVMGRAAALGILSLSELPADDACPLFAGAKQRTAVPRRAILEAEAQIDLEALAADAAQAARKLAPGVSLDRLHRESRAA
jgi:thiamine biosynthesis protein ThiI